MEETRIASPQDVNVVREAVLQVLQVDLKAKNIKTTPTGYTAETSMALLKNSWGELLTVSCEPGEGHVDVTFASEFKKKGAISRKNRDNVTQFAQGLIARLPGAREERLPRAREADPAIVRTQSEDRLPLVAPLHGGLKTALDQNRLPDEQVVVSLTGVSGQALVVTDRRVLVIKAGQASGSMFGQKVKSFDLSAVTSVEFSCGLSQGRVQISAPGTAEQSQRFGRGVLESLVEASQAENVVQFEASRKNLFQAAANRIRMMVGEAKVPTAPVGTTGPDIADQIKKLADLHSAGILTDDEFQNKKAELLSRM